MSWLALAACFSGCDLSPLKSGDLFASADGGREVGGRDGGGNEALPDASPDTSTDDASSEVSSDALSNPDRPNDPGVDASAPPDAASIETGTDAGCATSCDPGSFCNTLAGRCQPSSGHSMLSGVVSDKCDRIAVAALTGIAGQRQCSYSGKGSYFFASLPLGLLELAVVKPGYLPYTANVQIVEGGNVHDVYLTRANDPDCTGQRPAETGCSCDGAVCVP
jgi:hypothetical protein